MEKFDYYQETLSLIENLGREGQSSDAAQLQDAIDHSSTGTELVMSIRWHLKKMLQNRPKWAEITEWRGRRLLERLEGMV